MNRRITYRPAIPTRTVCSVCNEPQYATPSGSVCKNGHGGADSAPEKLSEYFQDVVKPTPNKSTRRPRMSDMVYFQPSYSILNSYLPEEQPAIVLRVSTNPTTGKFNLTLNVFYEYDVITEFFVPGPLEPEDAGAEHQRNRSWRWPPEED